MPPRRSRPASSCVPPPQGIPMVIARLTIDDVLPQGRMGDYMAIRGDNFTLDAFREFLTDPVNGVWGNSFWHNHGGSQHVLDNAQRVYTFCNMHVGDASAATQPFLANTGALAMAHGLRAADSVLAAMGSPPEIFSDGNVTYHVSSTEMSVIVDREFWWSVPITSRTQTKIIFGAEVSGTVAGVPTTVQYTEGQIKDGAFSWPDQPPSTLIGSASHPAMPLQNACA